VYPSAHATCRTSIAQTSHARITRLGDARRRSVGYGPVANPYLGLQLVWYGYFFGVPYGGSCLRLTDHWYKALNSSVFS
jgi:hypothetical protein